jgi:AraC family transcriptional regulator
MEPNRVTQGEPVAGWRLGSFTITEVRHRAGAVLALHDHPVGSMVLVVDGGYEEEVEGQRLQLDGNAIAYKPPGAVHRDLFPAGDVMSLCIEMPPDLLPERILFERAVDASRIARRVRAELHERAPGWQLLAEGLVLEAAGRLRRAETAPTGKWLDQLEEMLRAGEVRSLAAAARLLRRDPSHMARAFRTRFGRSIGSYVRDLRVQAICSELANTSKPLASIALEAGFCDQSHFTRVFSRTLQMTPGEYRRKHARR